MLGLALLQHQNSGVLSITNGSSTTNGALPLGDPSATTIMPEAWVRAAMLIRANSLVRGHSAVRWELLQSLADFLQHHITPLVPLRGSISASGDLSPLSYVALALSGNPAIRVYNGHPSSSSNTTMTKRIVPAPKAMEKAGLKPISLAPKEHLGLLNGTAFSAAVASLALVDVVQLAVLAQVCTAMGTEALLGTRGSYAPFIHEVARPHPGQIEVARVLMRLLEGSSLAGEVHETELTVDEDKGKLRQVSGFGVGCDGD
jgi:phenylalanine ammonia-lyase